MGSALLLESVSPCRKCGSEDISLWCIKKRDWICRSCKKSENRTKYLKNREHYINKSTKQYVEGDEQYGSKRWAQKVTYRLKSFDIKKQKIGICDLKFTDILDLIKKPCFYCDDTLDRIGTDRIDNSIGHIKTNIVPSCHSCNNSRLNNWSHQEMKLIGSAIKIIKQKRRKI